MKGSAHAEPGRLQPPSIVAIPPRLKQTTITCGGKIRPRDVKNEGRTDYVYENKQEHDKMSCEKSDIYVEVKRILQKTAGSTSQFAVNGVLWACFVWESTSVCRRERAMEAS